MGSSTNGSTEQQGATSDAQPKKYQRSQSPRAKERRRIQNRIAQRNHRQRLKEQSRRSSSKEASSEPPDAQEMSTLPSAHPSNSTLPELQSFLALSPMRGLENMITDDMSERGNATWPPLDQVMPPCSLPEIEPNHFMFHPPEHSCTCNSITGPCTRHLEDMRLQFINSAMGAFPRPNPPFAKSAKPMSAFDSNLSLSNPLFGDISTPRILNSVNPPPAHPSRMQAQTVRHSQSVSSPELHHSPILNESQGGFSRHRSNSGISKGPTPSPKNDSGPASSGIEARISADTALSTEASSLSSASSHDGRFSNGTSYKSSHIHSTPSNSTIPSPPKSTNDTERFNSILASVRAAGFENFDRMVAAYYTANFEKSSVPDMSQRASRGRRLAKLLKEVHESSVGWPRWEAKGFRDSAMEFAKKVCAEEMEKIARQSEITPSSSSDSPNSNLDQSPPSSNSTSSAMAVDSDDESRLLARLATLPLAEEVEAAVQDEAPFLWAILTELAGPQSLYCDRVSQAVLALLIDGRRTQ